MKKIALVILLLSGCVEAHIIEACQKACGLQGVSRVTKDICECNSSAQRLDLAQ